MLLCIFCQLIIYSFYLFFGQSVVKRGLWLLNQIKIFNGKPIRQARMGERMCQFSLLFFHTLLKYFICKSKLYISFLIYNNPPAPSCALYNKTKSYCCVYIYKKIYLYIYTSKFACTTQQVFLLPNLLFSFFIMFTKFYLATGLEMDYADIWRLQWQHGLALPLSRARAPKLDDQSRKPRTEEYWELCYIKVTFKQTNINSGDGIILPIVFWLKFLATLEGNT